MPRKECRAGQKLKNSYCNYCGPTPCYSGVFRKFLTHSLLQQASCITELKRNFHLALTTIFSLPRLIWVLWIKESTREKGHCLKEPGRKHKYALIHMPCNSTDIYSIHACVSLTREEKPGMLQPTQHRLDVVHSVTNFPIL